MTVLGKFFHWVASVPAWITKAFNSVDAESKILIPIAINIVEGIKKVMDNPATDMALAIAETAIPGEADNIIIDKVHSALDTWLPVILLKLQKIDQIVQIDDLETKLQAALKEIKFSSDEAKQMFWNDMGALMLSKMSNKITIQDAKVIIEDYYQTYVKKTV